MGGARQALQLAIDLGISSPLHWISDLTDLTHPTLHRLNFRLDTLLPDTSHPTSSNYGPPPAPCPLPSNKICPKLLPVLPDPIYNKQQKMALPTSLSPPPSSRAPSPPQAHLQPILPTDRRASIPFPTPGRYHTYLSLFSSDLRRPNIKQPDRTDLDYYMHLQVSIRCTCM